jgi:hypothetical protein
MHSGLDLRSWTRRTFLGWFVGVAFLLALSALLESTGIDDKQFHVGLAMAAGVGLCQMGLIRERFGVSTAWVWASALGMGIPFLAIDLLQPGEYPFKLMISAGLGGVGLAVLQYLLLTAHVRHPGLWIVGTSAGWMLSAAMVHATSLTMAIRPPRQLLLVLALLNLLIILTGSVVLGMITGRTIERTTTAASPLPRP